MNSYSDLLKRMQVLPQWQPTIDRYANRIIANRARYEEVSASTGVPWAFIAVLHYRESALNFNTHLHNGDSLKARTVHVPKGRPESGEPPFTWEESAIDALEYEKFKDLPSWTIEEICERAERYNGMGYHNMGKISPYLWSGTNLYVRGKYSSDGNYDSGMVDQQLGVIPLYLRVEDLSQESHIRKASRKIKGINRMRQGLQSLFGIITSIFTLDSFGVFKEWFSLANGVVDVKLVLGITVLIAIFWIFINWLDKLMMQDAKAGTWTPSGTLNTAKPNDDVPANPV